MDKFMKASEMIVQLEELIDKHGDLPLAMLEVDDNYHEVVFVEFDSDLGVHELNDDDLFYGEDDELGINVEKVILLD